MKIHVTEQARDWVLVSLLFLVTFPLSALAAAREDSYKLADGSPVPMDAEFIPAAPPTIESLIPSYPRELVLSGVGGRYEADLIVSSEGEVEGIEIVHSAGVQLNRVVARHVRKIQFSPAVLEGNPIASRYRLVLEFATRR